MVLSLKDFQKILLFSVLVLGLSLIQKISFAQNNSSDSNIYLSVNNILLNFEGNLEILNSASFGDESFSVTLPANTNFEVSSKELKSFRVEPTQYANLRCQSNASILTVENPTSKTIDVLISPLNAVCDPSLLGEIVGTIEKLRENPAAQKVIKEIVVPISVTVTAVSAGTLVVTASVGSASFAINLTQLLQNLGILRFYALGFLRFRRKKPWGRVIDRFSGKPLKGALIQIYEDEFKKIKDAQVTDEEGRFSAVVAPGRYFVKVSRVGFETYESNVFIISSGEQIINLEIALTPHIENFSTAYIRRVNVLNAVKRFLDKINPYLLFFGTLISIFAALIIPTIWNYIGAGVYIVLDVLKIYFAFKFTKPFGRVFDASNKRAIPLAVIRVFDEKNNFLLGTKVTDIDGRFSFLLSPGSYYITCAKAGFEVFRSRTLNLRKSGVAAMDIELKISTSGRA